MEYVLGGLVLTMLVLILYVRNKYNVLADNYNYTKDRLTKFENAYWQLYQSDAIDRDNYEIHIPWLTYGDNAIVKKTK